MPKKTKKCLAALGAILLIALTWQPVNANPLSCIKVADSVAVASLGSATTNIIDLWLYRYFSFQSKCTSVSGTAEYDLEFHTSSTDDTNMRMQDGSDLVTGDTSEAWTAVTSISPAPAAFGWFIIKGAGSNPADTVCSIWMCRD